MSFCLRPNVCKKCGKPLTLFEGWTCLECEKAEKEPVLEQIRAEITNDIHKCNNTDMAFGMQHTLDIIDKYKGV